MTKAIRCVKKLSKKDLTDEEKNKLVEEVNTLKGLDHPNIVKAHEMYTYKKQIFLVLELCDGGDLYTRSE